MPLFQALPGASFSPNRRDDHEKASILMVFFGMLLVPFDRARRGRLRLLGPGYRVSATMRTPAAGWRRARPLPARFPRPPPAARSIASTPAGSAPSRSRSRSRSIVALVKVSAAATDIVRIRNLSIQGITTGSTGILGTSMGALYVESVVITGFNTGNAAGIRFQPTNASAKLFVTDSIMDHNGISTTTGGG